MAAIGDFSWDDLRYFLRAAQVKTLAGAARAMGVEHTTIGRRLSALERALGAPLVLRGPEGLTLTPLGERMLPLALEVERAVAAARAAAVSQRAQVRLSIPQALTCLFTQALPQMRLDHPEIALEIIGANRSPDLKRGGVDLAVVVKALDDKDLVQRSLGPVGWSLYAAEANLARRAGSIDPLDLSGHDIVALNTDSTAAPAAKWLAKHAARATVVSRSNASAALIDATVAGAGLALLPCFLAEEEPALRRLTPDVLTSHPIWMVYRRELRIAQPVREVINFVVAVIRTNAERIRGKSAVG
jgi:DNA-binding transcriptional LysR family regulator